MENKPIVTCHGEQELFSSIHQELAQGLPREAVEWRRSYGRAPKMIHVDVNFVPYNPDLLPTENDRKLLQLPVFHTYWTECPDADAYKVCVKNDISAWLQALRERNVNDWLIILVETSNPKRGNKQKFLPRTSVLDKIRNDFCSKQSDRVIVLHEPNNPVPTPRAQDSWHLFMQRLRALVLQAYNRVLGRFEELIRAERENRNDKNWNFCRYFLLQEELAFMFETLRQFEDALVQYDELDALFSQFIINSSAGATTNWLHDFQAPCTCWDGLNLSRPVNMDQRDLLVRGKPTLLDVRNYLFSRQAALLFLLKRPWEVAFRAQNFMHNCVQELEILEVSMPRGSVACWVFLSCLEVLQKCEKSSDAAHINTYSHYTASLWLYAQKKLNELGELAGLMPDTAPTSAQLNSVVDLLSGMGQTAEVGARENSPNQMLREALSSQEAFCKHYLELSELAMGTFKHIGRMRAAKLIGQDLAQFYMKTKELHKAETFLSDSLKIYEKEGWPWLVAATRKQLAKCYKGMENKKQYLKLCCQLAADKLAGPDQLKFFEEMKKLAAEGEQDVDKAEEDEAVLSLSFICDTPTLSITPSDGQVGKEEVASLKVTFTSNLPAPITADQIMLQLHDRQQLANGNGAGSQQPMGMGKSPSQDSLGRVRGLGDVGSGEVKGRSQGGVMPDFRSEVKMGAEKPDGTLPVESYSLVCRNTDLVFQRQDSSTSLGKSKDVVTVETCSRSLVLPSVEILPGENEITFELKSSENGTFQPRQLILKIGNADFLANLDDCQEIEVFSNEAQLTISQETGLLAGLPQQVRLHLATGHTPVAKDSALTITTPSSLTIIPSETDEYRVEASEDGGKVVFLREVCNHGNMDVAVGVVVAMSGQTDGEKEERQDLQFSVDCPWSETVMTALEFCKPFTFQHRVYTAGQRKFVQVGVKSGCNSTFELSSQALEVRGERSLNLTPVMVIQSCQLQSRRTVSYVWEAKLSEDCSLSDGTCLQFAVNYKLMDTSGQAGQESKLPSIPSEETAKDRTSSYEFGIADFKTVFEVVSTIKPPVKEEQCKAGALCTLGVSIKMLDTPLGLATMATTRTSQDTPPISDEGDRGDGASRPKQQERTASSLMYEIDTDGGMWAVCGRSTGVITMPTKGSEVMQVTLEVIPLIAGFLPMPAIRLSRYVTQIREYDPSIHPLMEDSKQKPKSANILSDQKPTILPFTDSQVYYRSKACQVRVMPECNISTVEVAVS